MTVYVIKLFQGDTEGAGPQQSVGSMFSVGRRENAGKWQLMPRQERLKCAAPCLLSSPVKKSDLRGRRCLVRRADNLWQRLGA